MRLFISPHIRRLIDLALDEDDLTFDVTSNAFFADAGATATLRAKQDLVVAGLPMVVAVFERVDPEVRWSFDVADGAQVDKGEVFARATGNAAMLLKGERTALNFLQRMSGVATLTRAHVEALGEAPGGRSARVVDTRKTLPGYRELDKYAVRCGGGANHRYSLAGGVMVKDNHIAAAGSVKAAIARVKEHAPHTLRVEVEVETLAQLDDALEAGAEIVMLDNMDTETMRQAVARVREHSGDRVIVEASGNITTSRLPELRGLGLDYISVGALTHSAVAADISMKLEIDHE